MTMSLIQSRRAEKEKSRVINDAMSEGMAVGTCDVVEFAAVAFWIPAAFSRGLTSAARIPCTESMVGCTRRRCIPVECLHTSLYTVFFSRQRGPEPLPRCAAEVNLRCITAESWQVIVSQAQAWRRGAKIQGSCSWFKGVNRRLMSGLNLRQLEHRNFLFQFE